MHCLMTSLFRTLLLMTKKDMQDYSLEEVCACV